MAKTNGKSEAETLDTEHELPPADGDENSQSAAGSATAGASASTDVQKLKAERDSLLEDRKSTRLNSSHIQKSRMPSSA